MPSSISSSWIGKFYCLCIVHIKKDKMKRFLPTQLRLATAVTICCSYYWQFELYHTNGRHRKAAAQCQLTIFQPDNPIPWSRQHQHLVNRSPTGKTLGLAAIRYSHSLSSDRPMLRLKKKRTRFSQWSSIFRFNISLLHVQPSFTSIYRPCLKVQWTRCITRLNFFY